MLSLPYVPATMHGAAGDLVGAQATCGFTDRGSASQPERRTLRVLSFEDNYFFGERIRDALLAWEFDVEWCIGAADVSGGMLQGIAADSPAGEQKIVPIRPADVDIVFTDCMLIGRYSGVDIVRWCVENGVPVIAISGCPQDNRRMINAGAMLAVLKELVSRVVLAGLPVERLAGRG
jgi:DNA-binding response OmpR family regulator